MQLAGKKIYLVLGAVLLLAIYFLLDISFVKKSMIISEGLGFNSLEESKILRRNLDERGIPYTIEEYEGGVQILWDAKYLQANETNKLLEDNLLPEHSTGLCFSKESESAFYKFLDKLAISNIEHSTNETENEFCASWKKEADLAVQKVYPNLAQMRAHQGQDKR